MNLMVFDLGGTSVKYATYINEELKNNGFFKTPDTLEDLIEEMSKVMDTKMKIEGIAISSPGSVNQKDRIIEGISALPYIHFVPIYDLFEEAFNVPVTIENDANCAGLCEVEFGAAREGTNVISMVLGTGMGGSVFINRQLHVGSHLFGGEFGMSLNTNHLTASENGTLVANSKKYTQKSGKEVDGIELLTLYDQGEVEATQIINQMFDYIAETLYNIQVIIDPDTVVLGGGISNRKTLPEEISKRLLKHLEKIDIQSAAPKIVNAEFKNDANLIGAVINFQKNINQ